MEENSPTPERIIVVPASASAQTPSAPTAERSTIGQLNGWWAFLLKIFLIGFPIFLTMSLTWATWVTVGQFKDENFRREGLRVTPVDMAKLEAKIYHELTKLPPLHTREKLLEMSADIKSLEIQQTVIVRNQSRILAILESMDN